MSNEYYAHNLILRSARRARLEEWAANTVLAPILRDGATRLLRMRS
jgi:hypothetical protein